MSIQEEDRQLSERLEAQRRASGHTQAQAADIAGVSLSGYKRWEKGGPIPSDALRRLAAAGYDIQFIVTGYAEPGGPLFVRSPSAEFLTPDRAINNLEPNTTRASYLTSPHGEPFALIPVFDVRVSAGGGALNHHSAVAKHLAFRGDWVEAELRRDPANLVVVETVGDSMSPTLNENDTLLVDRTEHQLADGIYVLDAYDRLMVKRIQMLADGGVRLKSDNPAYGAEELRDQELEQLNVVGRVVWIGRRL